MRQLMVNIGEIASVMEQSYGEYAYYLDCNTGHLIIIPPEMTSLESLDEKDLEEFVDGLSEWERDLVPRVLDVYRCGDGRYAAVPQGQSREAYGDMVRFAGTVQDEELRELLFAALDGRGAFGRFKDVLAGCPGERQRWFRYKDERMEDRVRDWLRDLGIEPVDGPV